MFLHKHLLQTVQDETILIQLKRKTDQMFAFCSSANCRRIELLQYFGEVYEKSNCQACDNCLDEIEQIDGTIIAQKILSCVYRLNQRFGLNYVIDVLSGSKKKEILGRGHDRLSTYNILHEHSKQELRYYIFSLINMGFLLITQTEYPLLHLTPSSKKILFQNYPVRFRKRIYKTAKQSKNQVLEYDNSLFIELQELRREIAALENTPSYIVFHDKTLLEMAAYYPQNNEELLRINGVGPQKILQYGSQFLECIQHFCKTHNIKSLIHTKTEPKSANKTASEPKLETTPKEPGVNTVEQTLNLLRDKKSIEEIAKIRSLSPRTVSEHVSRLIELGIFKDIFCVIDQNKLLQILEVISTVGCQKLTPIKERLDETFSWDEISIAVGYHKTQKQ
jgi:ATP-dependent DNA helicase RecQ